MSNVSVKEVALRLLSQREHSQVELQQKLSRRGYEDADIDILLSEFVDEGWQSDQRYAQSYLRSRAMQGHGPVKIRQALRQRGVSEALIDAAFSEYDEQFWREQLQQVWDKKFRGQRPEDNKAMMRQQRFLQQRGFALVAINQWLLKRA